MPSSPEELSISISVSNCQIQENVVSGAFSQISLCSPRGPLLVNQPSNQKRCLQKLSSGTKEEAGFSGFNFSAAGFWI